MNRVDIEGLLDIPNPCLKEWDILVNREQLPLNQQPSNWNQFCDDMDQKLQQLIPLEKQEAWLNVAMIADAICTIAISIPLIITGNSNSIYMSPFFFGPLLVFSAIYGKILMSYRKVFLDIDSSCATYEMEGVVTYEFQTNEWCGGCCPARARRLFFVVNVSGAAEQDVEQQLGDNALSYPTQTYDQANDYSTASTTPANGGIS
jgi:hypothetical protein